MRTYEEMLWKACFPEAAPIGVDTVNLNGEGFETFVKDGDRVKKGDKLTAFDIEYIREHAKSDECIIVFTSLQEGEAIVMIDPDAV